MGRKIEIVKVPNWPGNRDAGKVFQITEMLAGPAEKWAFRAALLVENSGVAIPQEVKGLGMVGISILGLNVFLNGRIDPDKLDPLMDQMFSCVKIVRDPSARDRTTGDVIATELVSEDDVEEVQTRLWLRSEVLRVHTGFSPAEALSKLISAIQTQAASPTA